MADEKEKSKKSVKLFDKSELAEKAEKIGRGLDTLDVEVTETAITATNKKTGKVISIEIEES